MRLWMPPPGEEVTEGPWTAAAETAAFDALATAINGGRQRQGATAPKAIGADSDTMAPAAEESPPLTARRGHA